MDIFSCMDYRKFLRDYYEEQKAQNPSFSYRFFARMAGIRGQSYLRMVMDGQRGLTPSSINQFTKGLKLKKRESSYFENLVLYNQAKNEKEKDLYFERLVNLRPASKIHGIEKDQYEYFSKEHLVVIREMVALSDFKEDPQWIGEQLSPHLTPKQVADAIEALIRLGLLKRDENGRLAHSSASVKIEPEANSMELYNYHRTLLSKAKDAICQFAPDEREIISLTIPMAQKIFPQIKDIIRKCQEDIVHTINKNDDPYDEVFQVNIQCFPVTTIQANKKKKG